MPKRKAEEDAQREERNRQIVEAVKTRVQSLDEHTALDLLNTLAATWGVCGDAQPENFGSVVVLAFQNFSSDVTEGVEPGSLAGSLREMDDVIHSKELEALALYHRLRELNVFEEPAHYDKMNRCLEAIFYAKRIVLSAMQSRLSIAKVDNATCAGLDEDLEARLGLWSMRFRWFDSDINDFQKLLLHLLDCAMEKKYRKQEDHVFEPIIIDGFNTHAWKQVCTVEEFVYQHCQKELHVDAWLNLTSKASNGKSAIEYLKNCSDYQFPTLKKDRCVWAFQNGVYCGRTDTFHPYETDPLDESIVACKFFDMRFDAYVGTQWADIPTPALDSILQYQGLAADVSRWLYVMIGRMLYPLNTHDGWQVIPFLLGQAGSGKSSITVHVVGKLYDSVDCGCLSNNVEKQFGIGPISTKNIFIATEVKTDLKLEQSEFQSMVSGENMQIAIKHHSATSVKWQVPGFLAGNETPSWSDNSGSIQRRLVVFAFNRQVQGGDMRLGDKLESQMGALLLKANRAYREAAAMYGSSNIWEVLPSYFKSTRDEVAASVNSVEAFLSSSDVVLDPSRFCPFDDFKAALKIFESQNGYRPSKFTQDFFRGPFSKFGLRKSVETLSYGGRQVRAAYIFGVDFATNGGDANLLG
jgi:hypothetical protein